MGTATSGEVEAVEAHLLECDEHDEVASTAAAVTLLGSTVEPVNPPAALKSRVMVRVEATAIKPGVAELRTSTARPYRRWLFANPIAALLVVAIGVLVVWNIVLQTTDSPERFVHSYWGNENDWMRIETVLGEPGAEVSLGGIERLDEAFKYQLWTIRGDDVLLVGAFNVNVEGRWAGEFEFTFEEGDRVWMTEEPASGTDAPTGDVVLKTRF